MMPFACFPLPGIYPRVLASAMPTLLVGHCRPVLLPRFHPDSFPINSNTFIHILPFRVFPVNGSPLFIFQIMPHPRAFVQMPNKAGTWGRTVPTENPSQYLLSFLPWFGMMVLLCKSRQQRRSMRFAKNLHMQSD
jgi:hypothetical protein